jgi:hypothetical protein
MSAQASTLQGNFRLTAGRIQYVQGGKARLAESD